MDPIKFTRTDDDGNPRTRYAHTAADAVKLRFDGWTEHPAVDHDHAPRASTAKSSTKSGPPSASATDRAPTTA